MKKVCVVTWYGGTNYGTNLQAYALLKKLELMGYDSKIKGTIRGNINYFFHPSIILDRARYRIKSRFSDAVEVDRDSQKNKLFENFVINKLPKLDSIGRKEWNDIENEYIAFITGSDQVWNPNYFQASMMLDFVDSKKIKKISYASSIGVNSLSFQIKKQYKKLLRTYTAVSVREEQAAKLLLELSPVSVEVVLDPTMLLTCKEWDELADEAIVQKEWNAEKPYIFCYFVGDREDYSDYVSKVRQETGLECLIIPINVNKQFKDCKIAYGVGPNEFIWLLKHADLVLTDSFHASVFSILYHKEFYVLKRFLEDSDTSQNSRLHQILGMYNLESRWVKDESSFTREKDIDYESTDCILRNKRGFSEEFLYNSLEKGE